MNEVLGLILIIMGVTVAMVAPDWMGRLVERFREGGADGGRSREAGGDLLGGEDGWRS